MKHATIEGVKLVEKSERFDVFEFPEQPDGPAWWQGKNSGARRISMLRRHDREIGDTGRLRYSATRTSGWFHFIPDRGE